jgi:hypothetical protein
VGFLFGGKKKTAAPKPVQVNKADEVDKAEVARKADDEESRRRRAGLATTMLTAQDQMGGLKSKLG